MPRLTSIDSKKRNAIVVTFIEEVIAWRMPAYFTSPKNTPWLVLK